MCLCIECCNISILCCYILYSIAFESNTCTHTLRLAEWDKTSRMLSFLYARRWRLKAQLCLRYLMIKKEISIKLALFPSTFRSFFFWCSERSCRHIHLEAGCIYSNVTIYLSWMTLHTIFIFLACLFFSFFQNFSFILKQITKEEYFPDLNLKNVVLNL